MEVILIMATIYVVVQVVVFPILMKEANKKAEIQRRFDERA